MLYLHNRNSGKFDSVVMADDSNVIVSEPGTNQYRVTEIRLNSSKKTIIVYEIGFCDCGQFGGTQIEELDFGAFGDAQTMTIDFGSWD